MTDTSLETGPDPAPIEPSRSDTDPNFSWPFRPAFSSSVVLGFATAGGYFAFQSADLAGIVFANPLLNMIILAVFLIGISACFWQIYQIAVSVNWIKGFASGHGAETKPSRLLAPLAALMKARGARMQINSTSARSILESVATRIDEEREITRYIVNLLIFLGLLGTFYGLATTVPAIVDTIGNLEPREGETGADVFRRLQAGLQDQMAGMGVAFSSSLLGLAGSLIVGLLELFSGHGQNRFYRELEEWVSTITRIGFSSGEAEGGSDQDTVVAVLEHMDHQMETMRGLFAQSANSRAQMDDRMGELVDAIGKISAKFDREEAGADALTKVAESQAQLIQVLENQANLGGGGVDAESRMRLRSIDVQLLRILEEMAAGRQETTTDLRTDIAALTKAVRQLTRDNPSSSRRG